MLYEVLVHVPEAYAETRKIGENFEIYVENFSDDVVNTIRHGEVKKVPLVYDTILKEGDEIYFHHNIIRQTIDWEGKELPGMYDFDKSKGLYRCPLDAIFAIVRDGKFKALSPYCFVKPIKMPHVELQGEFFVCRSNDELDNYGIIKYGNEDLEAKGFKEGDRIIFSKDSEYTYNVFGEKLYRMKTSDILARVEEKAWTGEDNLSINQS